MADKKGYLVDEDFIKRTSSAVRKVERMARAAHNEARSAAKRSMQCRYCELTGGMTAASDPLTGASTCTADLLYEDHSVAAGQDVPTPGDYTPVKFLGGGDGITIVNRSVDLTASSGTMCIVMWSGIEWVPVWVDCS